MNRVLFDGIATQGSAKIKFHGGSEYAKFILHKAVENKYRFDVVFHSEMIIDNNIYRELQDNNYNILFVSSKEMLYDAIKKYSVFFSALPYDYSDYNGEAKFIGVIHGLRTVELPWDSIIKYYQSSIIKRMICSVVNVSSFLKGLLYKKYYRQFERLLKIKKASFLTVSNHSKYSLLTFYPKLQEQDVKVYYSPFSLISKEVNKRQCKQPYFLMVSGNRFEKNICRAVESFDLLIKQGKLNGFKIIITGCGNQPFFKKIKYKDYYELKPYVNKSELDELYQNAFCFVYPSLNEGFGYPPLLAMSCGVPVIASSSTSIPEVCDNAAIYFCPTNIMELSNRIMQIVLLDELRQNLIKRGYNRVDELQRKQNEELPALLDYIFSSGRA